MNADKSKENEALSVFLRHWYNNQSPFKKIIVEIYQKVYRLNNARWHSRLHFIYVLIALIAAIASFFWKRAQSLATILIVPYVIVYGILDFIQALCEFLLFRNSLINFIELVANSKETDRRHKRNSEIIYSFDEFLINGNKLMSKK